MSFICAQPNAKVSHPNECSLHRTRFQFGYCCVRSGYLLKAACESCSVAGVKVQSVYGMPSPCHLGISCGWPNPS